MARVWSGYVDSLVGGAISNYTRDVVGTYAVGEPLDVVPDFLAGGLCLVYTMLMGLGVKSSAAVNSLLTIINLVIMGLVVFLGIYYADIANWSSQNGGLLPYGFSGVIAGELFSKNVSTTRETMNESDNRADPIIFRCGNVFLRLRRLRFNRDRR